MPNISRLGDRTIGVCTHLPTIIHPIPAIPIGGQIITSAATSIVEGQPAARVGDTVLADCGYIGIITTGGTLQIEGSPVARIGDAFVGVYNGTIIGGCTKSDAQ